MISFALTFGVLRIGYFPLVSIRAFFCNQLKAMGCYAYIILPVFAMQLMWFRKILTLAKNAAKGL